MQQDYLILSTWGLWLRFLFLAGKWVWTLQKDNSLWFMKIRNGPAVLETAAANASY
jgi:hypothetical protein